MYPQKPRPHLAKFQQEVNQSEFEKYNAYLTCSCPQSEQKISNLSKAMDRSLINLLLTACAALTAVHVDNWLRRIETVNPSYRPPLAEMLETAALNDNSDVAFYCLAQGARFSNATMTQIYLGHSFATYQVLLMHGNDTDCVVVPSVDDILMNSWQKPNIIWARYCLENGADANLLIENSISALTATAEKSSIEMADLLLQHGAKMEGSAAIVIAAEKGRLDMVKFLLQKGADINEIGLKDHADDGVTQEGGSALHKAVTEEFEDVIIFLLDNGADVNLLDMKGRTPMMRAKENENDYIINLLERYGATAQHR